MATRFGFILLLMIFSSNLFSQAKYTISGYIKSAKTGESIINASVFINETEEGTSSNEYGFFSITLAAGEYDLVFSAVGYEPAKEKILLNK